MLSRPISCGVLATVDAMQSAELVPRFSPFDALFNDDPDNSYAARLQGDAHPSGDGGDRLCDMIELLAAD